MMKIKIIVIEDEPEIRDWIGMVLSADPELEIQAYFADAETCLRYGDMYHPDVVIMDIHLPGMNGIECMQLLKPRKPNAQFMMFTVFEEDHYVFDALCKGATGYLLKNTTPENLISAIKELYAGGSPMSSSIARKVISSFHQLKSEEPEGVKLTSREKELLQLLARGYRYKEIAGLLFISVETVRTHIRNIYEKLQVQSRTEALNKVFPKR
jgi:DNA-binding NarL/FixJ family response regulator